MRKGVQAFTVRDFLSSPAQCRESFKKIADMGYDSVQAWPAGGMTAQEMQDMLSDLGLVNCSSGGDYERFAKGEGFKEAVDQARIFGVKYIGVSTLPHEFRYTKDGMKRYAHSLNKIAAELKKDGCALIYHHHALEFYSFGDGVNGMDILTEETDPEGVFWTLDTHWLASSGVDPVYWIRKLKGRIPIIHFKDYSIVEGAEKIEDVHKAFAEVGAGNINWPPIVTAAKECGVEYVIVEQDICKGDPFDSLKISYEGLCRFRV